MPPMPSPLPAIVCAICFALPGCAPLSPENAELRRLEREIQVLEARLRQDPQPLGDWYPEYCTVHETRLRKDTVRILYGLPGEFVVQEWREARETQFPFAYTWGWGGCSFSNDSPKRVRVKFCPDCRTRRAEWVRDFEQRWLQQQPPATQASSH